MCNVAKKTQFEPAATETAVDLSIVRLERRLAELVELRDAARRGRRDLVKTAQVMIQFLEIAGPTQLSEVVEQTGLPKPDVCAVLLARDGPMGPGMGTAAEKQVANRIDNRDDGALFVNTHYRPQIKTSRDVLAALVGKAFAEHWQRTFDEIRASVAGAASDCEILEFLSTAKAYSESETGIWSRRVGKRGPQAKTLERIAARSQSRRGPQP